MEIDFIDSGPAILVEEDMRILVAADLHMGIESELRSHGIHFRSRGEDRIRRLLAISRDTSPDIILLLGDIKHRVPGTSLQEFRELPGLFQALRKNGEVLVSPGNHDPGIEAFLRPSELLRPEGTVIDGNGYLHGHMHPDSCLTGSLIIAGHHHPVVSLRDEVGPAIRSPCYILGELRHEPADPARSGDEEMVPAELSSTRILFIPAFNEFAGYGIERTFRSPFSPLSRSLIVETAECLLPDGSYGGDLAGILRHDNDTDA